MGDAECSEKQKCPGCGGAKTKRDGKPNGVQRYYCKECRKHFRATRESCLDAEEIYDSWLDSLNSKKVAEEFNTTEYRIKQEVGKHIKKRFPENPVDTNDPKWYTRLKERLREDLLRQDVKRF